MRAYTRACVRAYRRSNFTHRHNFTDSPCDECVTPACARARARISPLSARSSNRVHQTLCLSLGKRLSGLLRAMIIKIDKTRRAIVVRKYLDRAINNRHRRGDIPHLTTFRDISFIIAKRDKSAVSNYYIHGKLIGESVTLLLRDDV